MARGHHLAAASALLLLLAGLAGLALLPGYAPTPEAAHASVAALARGAWGWARGLHAWAASLAMLLLLLHLARAWVRGEAAERPAAWLGGVAGVALLAGAMVGGGILAWDQQGWESLQHARALAGPLQGQLGDPEEPGTTPLRSLWLLHALGLPAAFAALAALLAWREPGLRDPSRLRGLARDAAPLAGLAAGLAGALALVSPPPHGPAPIPGLALSKPDWPFLWLTPVQDVMGPAGAGVGLAALGLLAAGMPWLGRHWSPRERARALVALAGVLLVLSALGLGPRA